MIDTTTVSGRRHSLRFETIDAMVLESRRCVDAARGARLRRLGNWTLGQALNHVAAWIDFPYLGYPAGFDLPEPVKEHARANKARILRETMKPGEHLPGLPAGTLAIEIVPEEQGLAHLESASARLRGGDPPIPDPVFGPVTAREWTEMSLRHAELHLSFFIPE